MSEWHDMQKEPNTKWRDLLKSKKAKKQKSKKAKKQKSKNSQAK